MLEGLTPRAIVQYLDKYIVGQRTTKRMVAIAIRNRLRRRQLPPEIARDITPKNILMIGPTGVGKTEIARRLSKLIKAPFVKVEATKYTEVGYVGRDVESIVRDLVENAVTLTKAEKSTRLEDRIALRVEERILDLLEGPDAVERHSTPRRPSSLFPTRPSEPEQSNGERSTGAREELRRQLRAGELDDKEVEADVYSSPTIGLMSSNAFEDMDYDMRGVLDRVLPRQTRPRHLTVAEAREYYRKEATEDFLDPDDVAREAVERASQDGIIFIDEFDKIAGGRGKETGGPDISREGVQRDILPIVEGCSVTTKYGVATTDHVLFIAAGAFNHTKPSDLIPELQGRFPLRCELEPLTKDDFQRILVEPEHSLTKQYQHLLNIDGVELVFHDDGIEALAEAAFSLNERVENIGARRLHTVVEKVLEDISFDAPEAVSGRVAIDGAHVRGVVSSLMADEDLQRYIL